MKKDRKTERRPLHPKVIGRRRRFKRWGYIIIFLCICIGLLTAARSHYQTTRAQQLQTEMAAVQNGSSKSFSQMSPDMPLYMLLVGVDKEKPQQANFIAVAAINTAKQHVDFIMLPDTTKVDSRQDDKSEYLRDVYGEGGLPLLQAVVEDIFHIPIPFYAVFTEDTFSRLLEMNNGFSMYVEKPMYHGDKNGHTEFNIFQGYQRLNGQEAVGYMRYLDADGEIARVQRQERLVKLFYQTRRQHWGWTNMLFMYRFWNHVQSNIKTKDMAKLAYTFSHAGSTQIKFYILPGEADTGATGYWIFDPVEVQKLIGTTNNAIASPPSTTPSETMNTGEDTTTGDAPASSSSSGKEAVTPALSQHQEKKKQHVRIKNNKKNNSPSKQRGI